MYIIDGEFLPGPLATLAVRHSRLHGAVHQDTSGDGREGMQLAGLEEEVTFPRTVPPQSSAQSVAKKRKTPSQPDSHHQSKDYRTAECQVRRQETYVDKGGKVLHGEAATCAILRSDVLEILRETGLDEDVGKKQQGDNLAGRKLDTRAQRNSLPSTPVATATTPGRAKSPPQTEQSGKQAAEAESKAIEIELLRQKVHSHKTKCKRSEGEKKDPSLSISAVGVDRKYATASATGVSGTLKLPHASTSVKGAELSAANADGKGLDLQLQAKVSASATGLDAKLATADFKGLEMQGAVSATAEAKVVELQSVNVEAKLGSLQPKASASASAKGVAVKAIGANIVATQETLKAEASADAEGAYVNAATTTITGINSQQEARARATAYGLETKAGQVNVVGIKEQQTAQVTAEAKGFKVTAAVANIKGKENVLAVSAGASVVGGEFEAATFELTGGKTGATSGASVKAGGVSAKVARVRVQGVDSSVASEAVVDAGGFETCIANAEITAHGGMSATARAELKGGADLCNVRVGTHSGVGVGFSTKPQIACAQVSIGPPSLTFSPGLKVGFGGSSSRGGTQHLLSTTGDHKSKSKGKEEGDAYISGNEGRGGVGRGGDRKGGGGRGGGSGGGGGGGKGRGGGGRGEGGGGGRVGRGGRGGGGVGGGVGGAGSSTVSNTGIGGTRTSLEGTSNRSELEVLLQSELRKLNLETDTKTNAHVRNEAIVPDDRDGLKEYYIQRLKPLKIKLDETRAIRESMSDDSKLGDTTAGRSDALGQAAIGAKSHFGTVNSPSTSKGAAAGGSNLLGATSTRPPGASPFSERSGAVPQDSKSRVRSKKKPRYGNKKIVTLDDLKDESPKVVKRLGGMVFGFQDQ